MHGLILEDHTEQYSCQLLHFMVRHGLMGIMPGAVYTTESSWEDRAELVIRRTAEHRKAVMVGTHPRVHTEAQKKNEIACSDVSMAQWQRCYQPMRLLGSKGHCGIDIGSGGWANIGINEQGIGLIDRSSHLARSRDWVIFSNLINRARRLSKHSIGSLGAGHFKRQAEIVKMLGLHAHFFFIKITHSEQLTITVASNKSVKIVEVSTGLITLMTDSEDCFAPMQKILSVIRGWVIQEPILTINPVLSEQLKHLTIWLTHKDPLYQTGSSLGDRCVLRAAGIDFPSMIKCVWMSACLIINAPDEASRFFVENLMQIFGAMDEMFDQANNIKPVDQQPACTTIAEHPVNKSFYVSTLWWGSMQKFHKARETEGIKPPEAYKKLEGMLERQPLWTARQ